MKLYPMVLTPFVSETVWGGRRLIDEYSVVTDKRNAAEAWVMSAHKNGSSTVANGEFAGKSLREVYLEHPELGGKNCAGFSDFPVLIKFIDAAADLSVQVHPDDAYCLKKGSGAGKTESWYILDCEPGAYLLLGFEKDITREQFRQSITDGTLTDYVKKVPVKKGDFFFIESGTLHAICKGILLAEVQQNSDTTYRIYDYGRLGFDGKPRELHVEDAVNVTHTGVYKNPCTPKKTATSRILSPARSLRSAFSMLTTLLTALRTKNLLCRFLSSTARARLNARARLLNFQRAAAFSFPQTAVTTK